MLLNYLIVSFRSLWKNKGYSFINTISVAAGFACFTLILLYVEDELGYDDQYGKQVYRIATEVKTGENVVQSAQSPPVWCKLMPQEFPEIEEMVRIKPPFQSWMVSNEGREMRFAEKGWFFADSNVFSFFKLRLKKGDPSKALSGLSKVVITESMEKRYFGNEDALGKTLLLDRQFLYEVTGVMEDAGDDSHFRFDFIAPFENLRDTVKLYQVDAPEAFFPFSYTYIRLKDQANPTGIEARAAEFVARTTPERFRANDATSTFFLQPIGDIHLHSRLQNEIQPNGSAMQVYFFMTVGVFVMLIACINFTNLATARSAKRFKEVGVRKAIGAFKSEIITQFLGETFLLVLASFVVGLVLVYVALPSFNAVSEKTFQFTDTFQPQVVFMLSAAFILTVFLSGSYPAFVIGSVRSSEVLKAGPRGGLGGKSFLRKGLIIFQFTISVFLIVSTIVVYRQMQFAQSKDLGLNKDQVVVIQLTDPSPRQTFRAYKSSILMNPDVLNVSASFSAPGTNVFQGRMKAVNSGSDELVDVSTYFSEFDFASTLGIPVVAGREFTAAFPADTLDGIMVNEMAVKAFGWGTAEDALGKEIQFPGFNTFRIIGVTRDFHNKSVHEPITPTVMGYFGGRGGFYGFARINVEHAADVINFLRDQWSAINPGYYFDYAFLDENFAKLYKSDRTLNLLLTFFSALTIFVACLGLLGLSTFMAEQRAKEISIRKVNGAGIVAICVLLLREFTFLILIGFVAGSALAGYAMSEWLDRFAYKISIHPLYFVSALVLLMISTLITVGYQLYTASKANPIIALRMD